ncbi:MAG: YggT family protein [Nocardioidaceae bacterium]
MQTVGSIIAFLLWLYIGLMLARLVVDWVQVFARSWTPTGPMLVILEIIYTLTDPPINFVRRYVPPLRIGNMALDLAFLIVLLLLYVLQRLNVAIFFG